MKILLIGMKASGKTTIGRLLAQKMKVKHIELDREIEKVHKKNKGESLTFREIYKKYGEDYFRSLESQTLQDLSEKKEARNCVLSVGGGTPLNEGNRLLLKKMGKIVFLNTDKDKLLKRIIKGGTPAFFPYPSDPERSLEEILSKRIPIYKSLADYTVYINDEKPEEVAEKVFQYLFPEILY